MIKVLIFSCVFVTVLAKIITFKDCGTYSYDLDLAKKKKKKKRRKRLYMRTNMSSEKTYLLNLHKKSKSLIVL